jgi:hypothetical protein
MHVQAIGATIDLRCTHLYQLEKAGIEAAALDIIIECRDRLHGFGRSLIGIEPGFHGGSPRG